VLRGATRAGALAAIAACADRAPMMAPELSPENGPSFATAPAGVAVQASGSSTQYPLYAGGGGAGIGTLAGYVNVSSTGDADTRTFTVTFTAAPGFCFEEGHLAITGGEATAIPQRNGNPAPGQFAYNADPATCSPTLSFPVIGPIELTSGDAYVIAAHAVVSQVGSAGYTGGIVVSTPGTVSLTGRRDGNVSGFTNLVGLNAVAAWEPNDVGGTSFWDSQIATDPDGQWLAANGADWLWETFRTNTRRLADGSTEAAQSNTINGSVVRMVTTISPTAATTGTFRITCDNGYRVELTNSTGTTVVAGGDGDFAKFLTQLSTSMSNNIATQTDLTQLHVSYDGWQSVENYSVNLAAGLNTFTIYGVNEYMFPNDPQTTPPDGRFNPVGDENQNPGGCIFGVEAAAVPGTPTGGTETAWGRNSAGIAGEFGGRNWATYIYYRTQ
jgi:hypothetical protein